MTTSSPNHLSDARDRRRAGFTMTEMMVATSIGTLILAGVLTTYVMTVKSFQALSNYWEIHSDGRYAVDRFASDMRAVSAINSLNATQLVCVVPTAFTGTGLIVSNKTVSYSLAGGSLYRSETISGTTATKKLASNIYLMSFQLYDKLGNPTASLSIAKAIQVDIKLRKFTVSQIQSEDYLSARLDMRNKP
jgi:prepilin-type N-terminal cleavage/methylation domain-containing protein